MSSEKAGPTHRAGGARGRLEQEEQLHGDRAAIKDIATTLIVLSPYVL